MRFGCVLLALLVAPCAQARPVVEKVDPPNWWVRHTWNPIQVLVTGHGFAGVRSLLLAQAFLLTTRGIPHLYYGDEIALGESTASRDAMRADFPGGFPGDPIDAFTPPGRSGDTALVFDALRRLLAFRRDHEAVRRGRLMQLLSTDDQYAYLRTMGDQHVLVALDRSRAGRITLDVADVGLRDGLRLASWIEGESEVRVAAGTVHLPGPRDVHIYRSRR